MAHGEFELGNDGPSVILVGVDDSVTASRAAWYAAGLARRQGARMVAVHVEPNSTLMLTSPAAAGAYAAETEAHHETDSRSILRTLKSRPCRSHKGKWTK